MNISPWYYARAVDEVLTSLQHFVCNNCDTLHASSEDILTLLNCNTMCPYSWHLKYIAPLLFVEHFALRWSLFPETQKPHRFRYFITTELVHIHLLRYVEPLVCLYVLGSMRQFLMHLVRVHFLRKFGAQHFLRYFATFKAHFIVDEQFFRTRKSLFAYITRCTSIQPQRSHISSNSSNQLCTLTLLPALNIKTSAFLLSTLTCVSNTLRSSSSIFFIFFFVHAQSSRQWKLLHAYAVLFSNQLFFIFVSGVHLWTPQLSLFRFIQAYR